MGVMSTLAFWLGYVFQFLRAEEAGPLGCGLEFLSRFRVWGFRV